MPKYVYIVENNWGDDSSINVFRTKRGALKNYKAQVREQLEPDTAKELADEMVKIAVAAERFEYSGNGDGDYNPFIDISRFPVQE